MPLIQVYQQVIDRNGAASAIREVRPASDRRLQILVIGPTHIVAEGFAARRHPAPG
jgi:hypothetical protein